MVYNGNVSAGYELFYDANGRLYKTVDRQAGLTYIYEYDSLNRLIFAWQKNTSTGATVLEVHNAYDELGRTKGSTYVIGNTTQTYGITYEDVTGLVASYTTPQNHFRYFYDSFDRPTIKSGNEHAIHYTYVTNSQRVASYSITQTNAPTITYSYTYDALGNITSIKKNGITVSNYEYDSLGRLIREDDCANSVSWVYTYDNSGNLQQKYTFYGMCGAPASHMIATHPYNGSEISSTYTYSDSAWGDLLTNYNGTEIEYDTIGNPTNWRNATNMEWYQRSLTSMSVGGMNVSYTYNADGIRTTKTHGHMGHTYVLDGSTILKETIYNTGTVVNTLYYYYDESGISGLEYNGTKYAYVKNLQGDVIRIITDTGATVVEYKYDAWGNILSVTGSLASTLGATNPFRYRGYYYDIESGWYYLNNRYYDPQVGRFINADGVIAGVGGGISDYNLFAYCFNNPVNMQDHNGNWPDWSTIVGAVVAVAAIVVTAATLGAAAPAAACTITSMALYAGASYTAATTIATAAVVTTGLVATTYAGDVAYSLITGESVLLDTVFQGNKDAYNVGLTISSIATSGMLELAAQSPGVCFAVGTLVLTSQGYVSIEEIVAGDKVWATNPETGEIELKEVVQLFIGQTDEWVHIFAGEEEIICTPEHPFYSPTKGWIVAANLRVNDVLVTIDGSSIIINRIYREKLEVPETTYNFEVEDFHTYYVSELEVLVHNSCNHNLEWQRERRACWKYRAQTDVEGKDYGAYVATVDNINRMSQGLAPIGWDGHSVQLHHWRGILIDFYDYSPVSWTLHKIIHQIER